MGNTTSMTSDQAKPLTIMVDFGDADHVVTINAPTTAKLKCVAHLVEVAIRGLPTDNATFSILAEDEFGAVLPVDTENTWRRVVDVYFQSGVETPLVLLITTPGYHYPLVPEAAKVKAADTITLDTIIDQND